MLEKIRIRKWIIPIFILIMGLSIFWVHQKIENRILMDEVVHQIQEGIEYYDPTYRDVILNVDEKTIHIKLGKEVDVDPIPHLYYSFRKVKGLEEIIVEYHDGEMVEVFKSGDQNNCDRCGCSCY